MTEQIKRPTFLTVLCILSFIGIAASLFNAIKTILVPEKIIAKAEQAQLMMEEMGSQSGFLGQLSQLGQMHPAVLDNLVLLSIVSLVLSLVLLFGIIKMWTLRKMGYYVYVSVKVLGFIIPYIIIRENFLSGIALVISVFFTLLFILFYGLNLKAMK